MRGTCIVKGIVKDAKFRQGEEDVILRSCHGDSPFKKYVFQNARSSEQACLLTTDERSCQKTGLPGPSVSATGTDVTSRLRLVRDHILFAV